ncbi:MAG: hypothetical protein M3Q98_12095 [Actinomycetota bacterium]|nr:hypothetical protein [Actinomycetota bacterium]
MTDQGALKKPIGWWLKEADARINAAFDESLSSRHVDRRGWQVLTSLARTPTSRADVAASLSSFDEPAVVEAVVEDLRRRRWVEESDGLLRLTATGTKELAELAPLIAEVRQKVSSALPGDDYVTLVRLLERLVTTL